MKKYWHWRLGIAALVMFVVVNVSLMSSVPAQPGSDSRMKTEAAPAGSAPSKLALLVGINEYGNPQQVSPLAGSINDVEDMLQVLTTKFEFPRENIKVLKNADATHANIIDAIRNHLIAKAKPGDIVVFEFSGHGSQMKDTSGKKISGLDETLVPYDSRDPKGKVFDISGAELHGLLLQLAQKTPNVTFILDSCHSGTLVRDAARQRSIPADTRKPPPPPSYAVETTRGLGTMENGAPLKYVLIAAATSKESAYEHVAEGKDHGALTYFLTQQLRGAKAGATYRDVMDGVISNVTAIYPAQHPQLEGAEADQHVFGDSSSLARNYVLTSPIDSRQSKLSIGQVEGATVGSLYDVYAPGSRKFAPPEQPVAHVRLTKVDAFESEAGIVSGGKIAPASRAVERSHRYGNSRMRICLDHLDDSKVLRSIRDALQPFKQIEVANVPVPCHLHLREVKGKIQTLGADLSALSPSIDVNNPAVVKLSVERIKSWAKYFNVLSISNVRSGIDVRFTLKASKTRDPMARVGKPDMGVWDGETLDAVLQNDSDRDLYIAILDLSSDGMIKVVYPSEQGAHEVLTPGATLTRTLVTSLPKGQTRVTDILKVFASYKPIDLSPLVQGQIRGVPTDAGEPDPLGELLADSVGETRQVAAQPLNLGTWTAVQRVLVVKRKN
jgi:uncharacterized caspase-like protein